MSKIINKSRSQDLNSDISRFQSSNDQSAWACSYPPLPVISLPPCSHTPASVTPTGPILSSTTTSNLPFLLLRKLLFPLYLLVLSHLSVLSIKNHFLRRWYPNPKCDPLAYVFITLRSFLFHPSCFVITHLMLPSPVNYKLQQGSDHICLLFTL